MLVKKSFEERIKALESGISVPGTVLQRCLIGPKKSGIMWSLGIGGLGLPKKFYIGPTIEDVLKQAEKDIKKYFTKM